MEALWNGHAGRAWVEAQESLDRLYKPFEDLLVDAASPGSGHRVLDVGCGTGGTTLAVARLLGPTGHCIGVDISEPMIALARTRAERENTPARFVRADAQTHVFEPAYFDLIISRFGVMFFGDPVLAFANLRRAARSGATVRVIVWRTNGRARRSSRPFAPLLTPLCMALTFTSPPRAGSSARDVPH
jgi:ubiquinone/menaquinone biosynthesis C-methylase UbiE